MLSYWLHFILWFKFYYMALQNAINGGNEHIFSIVMTMKKTVEHIKDL